MKQTLFWLCTPLTTMVWFVLLAAGAVFSPFQRVVNVFELLCFRWECYAHDVQPGYLLNCPWRMTYAQSWNQR